MEFKLLSKETAAKIRQLSVIFNTVISLIPYDNGFYLEMFINHRKITISKWALEHHSVEYIAKTIVHLVLNVANFGMEDLTNDIQ